ncbi:MAG: oligosaccharide flippase family protein [Candidatus Promineifilaceae bacterium]
MAGFLILPLLLYGAVSIGGQTMLPVDNLYQWQPWASQAPDLGLEYPQNGLISDLILENYPWKQFIDDSVSAGEIPLWNPYIFAGTPFLATGQNSAYYPFSALFVILPLPNAYGWYTISQLWLAGILAYVLGRVLSLRRPSAAITGLVYQGCGFMLVSSAVFPMILGAAVWLPLLLASVEMIIRNATSKRGAGSTLPWAALGAVALGIQILAGHIEITYYTLLVMAFFALWRLVSKAFSLARREQTPVSGTPVNTDDSPDRHRYLSLLKVAIWLAGVVAAGFMLGGVQFLPFIEVGQANFREGSATLEQIRGWAFPIRRAITFALPDFFGNPTAHQYLDVFSGKSVPFTTNYFGTANPHGAFTSSWGIKNYVEGGIYLGILPLILAVLGILSAWRLRRDRRSEIGFFALLSALSIAFIFGTPLYAILYYGLPGINQLHSPFRWVFPLSLAVAVLAGYGMDYAAQTRNDDLGRLDDKSSGRGRRSPLISIITLRANPSPVTVIAGLTFWLGAVLLVALVISRFIFSNIEANFTEIFLNLERAADAFASARAFYSYQFEQMLILGLVLVASGLALRLSRSSLRWRGRPMWDVVIAFVIGIDLLVAGYGFNSANDPALLNNKPTVTEWLDSQPGLWRMTAFTPHGDKVFNANTPWLLGYQDVRGYDSIILKQYTDYMEAIEPQNELAFNRIQSIVNWESLNSPLLDLLGVKYIVSSDAIDLPKLKPVWQGEGVIVYENLAVAPRAYTLPQRATLVVDDALQAMRSQDPRLYAIVERVDWPFPTPQNVEGQYLVPAEIVDYGNIEVKIRAAVDEPSWLLLNDTYFPGWDAYARDLAGSGDGEEEELEVIRVNGNFRGVLLEPGDWEIRFRYSPLTFKLGGLTTFMGGIIVLFAVVVWAWRRFYKPQGPMTDTLSIAKNSLAPMSLNLLNRAIDFVFAAFYLRILGPADAGSYATAIIIAGWFEIISNWGLNTLIIREVSRDKLQASRYLLNTTVLRLGTGIMASIPILVYVITVRNAGNPLGIDATVAIFLLMIGMVFSGMGQGFAGLFYAYEKAEFNAAITTVTTILKVGFGVLVLLMGYGFVGLAGVSILVNLLTLVLLAGAAFMQLSLPGPWIIDFGLQRRMITLSYPLMLNHLFAVIFFQVDVPLMRQINGDKVVGWYNSAYKWINAFNVIPSFFTFALFPVISRQAQKTKTDARRTFRMSIKLMLLMAFPIAAVTTLLAPLMIGILGGREFLPDGAFALQLVVWSIPIGWMNSVSNYVLVAFGLEKRLTIAFVIGLAFNVIANLIFLPRFSYVAASIITIFSEIVLLILFAYYLRPALPDVGWLKIIKRPLAVTAIMLWAMVVGSMISVFMALVFGVGAFLIGLWLFRVIGDDEQRIIGSLLPDGLANLLPVNRAARKSKR